MLEESVSLTERELEILIKAIRDHERKCDLTVDKYDFDNAVRLQAKLLSAYKDLKFVKGINARNVGRYGK